VIPRNTKRKRHAKGNWLVIGGLRDLIVTLLLTWYITVLIGSHKNGKIRLTLLYGRGTMQGKLNSMGLEDVIGG
jgi:hypothetical protein